MSKQTEPPVALANLPTDDLLGFCPDKMFLVRCQDAEGELLPCAGLPIHHICALVHVDGALREGGGLQVQSKSLKRGGLSGPTAASRTQPCLQSSAFKALHLTHSPTHPRWDLCRGHQLDFTFYRENSVLACTGGGGRTVRE